MLQRYCFFFINCAKKCNNNVFLHRMSEFWKNYAYICSIIATLCRNRLVRII